MESTEEKKGSVLSFYVTGLVYLLFNLRIRSEERRVGKEC